MRLNKKYRISLEDESSLEKKIQVSARFPVLIFIILIIVVVSAGLGILVFAATPMKNYLPGYLKDSERVDTEEQQLRLDSLIHVYEVNQAYIDGISKILNPVAENKEDSVAEDEAVTPLSVDSLMDASEEEREFVENIRERDKYNINYISPAAAYSLMFSSVNKSAVISESSKDKYKAEILLPEGANITAVADGKVISVAHTPRLSDGYEVIIQHPKGFISKSSRLSHLLVTPGDRVASGQIIANGVANPGVKKNYINFELWHDGDPLVPSQYLKNFEEEKPSEVN